MIIFPVKMVIWRYSPFSDAFLPMFFDFITNFWLNFGPSFMPPGLSSLSCKEMELNFPYPTL